MMVLQLWDAIDVFAWVAVLFGCGFWVGLYGQSGANSMLLATGALAIVITIFFFVRIGKSLAPTKTKTN